MAVKKETTLRCVGVLTAIAVICGLLLAILNPLLYVAPTVDDIKNNFGRETAAEWSVEEVDAKLAKGISCKVLMVGKLRESDKTYIGMTVHTNSDGKLGESTFVMYFDWEQNTLIRARFISEGATGGYTYKDYCAGAIGDENADFSPYLVEITGKDIFANGKFNGLKTGATRTANSVDHAFNLAANYYYDKYFGKYEKGGVIK